MSTSSQLRWTGVLLMALGGCQGTVGGIHGPGDEGGPGGGQALCEQSPPVVSAPLRRLSRVQYQNVVTDTLRAWAPSLADAVLASPAVQGGFAQLRADERVTGAQGGHGGFRRLDQVVAQEQVDASLAIGKAIGAQLTSSTTSIGTLLGACATDADKTNDAACVRSFIERAAKVAERRAVAADDVDFYVSVYAAQGIDAGGLADVIAVMLTGPYFFYQVEHGGEVVDAAKNRLALDAQELANRLSLQFWNSIPDATLQSLVASQAILSPAGYTQALEHVMASPQVAQVYGEFFREFLSAEDLGEIDRFVGTPLFDAVRGSFTPSADTREHMIDEVSRLASYYAARPDGTFADLLTTRKSFATTPDVAALYGVAPWSGSGEPPEIADPERVGLLTHAAMVATGSPSTRPIIKGVFVRTALMCDTIPPPPANAMQVAQDTEAMLDPVMSTRARVEAITKRSECASCHATVINPLGFLLEGFDSLGRVRHSEPVFDQAGKKLGEVPIDTTSVPRVLASDSTMASGPADLAQLLIKSGKPQTCMATKYYRFSFAQLEDKTNDACLIQTLGSKLAAGTPIGAVMAEMAKTESFRQRVFD